MNQTSQEFINYYDDLYKSGYMDEWEESKKNRIIEILESIKIPENGKILDFGCGTGVFSGLLKTKFPHCEIIGCEITNVALEIAKQKYTDCTFLTNDEVIKLKDNFDFVFTHHVLEHVPSIEITLKEISDICKENASVLHILPCGNTDSYEYNLTNRVKNGIDKNVGNRFFYEDPGHLRRLTSDQLNEEMKKNKFNVKSSYFANQYFGAISWISKSNVANIFNLTDYKKANSINDGLFLFMQRLILLCLFVLSFSPKYFLISVHTKYKKAKHIIFIILFFIPCLISYPVYKYIDMKSLREWKNHNKEKNGSEMYLLFFR